LDAVVLQADHDEYRLFDEAKIGDARTILTDRNIRFEYTFDHAISIGSQVGV
jgi:UDP-N-acetyl-D-mannosaminuronate dehydrogenase